MEALAVGEVGGVGILRNDGNGTERAGGLLLVFVELKGAGEEGIEAGNGSAYAESGTDKAVCPGARSAGSDRGATGAGADGAAESAHAAARGVLDDSRIDAKNRGAGLGAEKIGIRNVQVVAGDLQVEIVFKSEGDRVIDREVNLTVMHERVDARGIAQARLRKWARHVRLQQVWESGSGDGVVLEVNLFGLGRLRRRRRCG